MSEAITRAYVDLLRKHPVLPDYASEAILQAGREAVPPLLEVLTDRSLWSREGPAGGIAPVHAAFLLGELQATEALPHLVGVVLQCDPKEHGIYHDAMDTLVLHFPETEAVSQAVKTAYQRAETAEQRWRLGLILVELDVYDEQVDAILARCLDDDPVRGGQLLGLSAQAGSLELEKRAFDAVPLDAGALYGGLLLPELAEGIELHGGSLTAAQRARLEAAWSSTEE